MENQYLSSLLLRKRTLLFIVGFFLVIILLVVSNNKNADKKTETVAKVNVAVGDLIFRAGTGYESHLIQKLSGSQWSHVGVVVATEPNIQIIHATTDDKPAYSNQVIQSTLAEFTDKKLAFAWNIYRIENLSQQEREILIEKLKSKLGQPFILGTRDEPHRYCTTIIADSLPAKLKQQLPWTETSFIGFQGQLLYPNALLQLASLKLIHSSSHLPHALKMRK